MAPNAQLSVYRSCKPVVDTQFDRTGKNGVIAALTDALADAAGVDTTELPPLYDSVDPDALTQLFLQRDESADSDAIFSFRYDTWNVFVRADGRIRVCDGTEHVDPTPVFQ